MSVHEQDRDGTPTLALQDLTGGYGRTTVVRDIDILAPMAERRMARVAVSVTTKV